MPVTPQVRNKKLLRTQKAHPPNRRPLLRHHSSSPTSKANTDTHTNTSVKRTTPDQAALGVNPANLSLSARPDVPLNDLKRLLLPGLFPEFLAMWVWIGKIDVQCGFAANG